jgi:uncharacterized protein YlxW (UPF0749 family)
MSTEISKKEVATVSAAIASYLARQRQPENVMSTVETQKALELLSEKVLQLEKQVTALAATVNDLKSKVEKTEK